MAEWVFFPQEKSIHRVREDKSIFGFFGVLKGPGVCKGRGCSWGTLKIPFGKIGKP